MPPKPAPKTTAAKGPAKSTPAKGAPATKGGAAKGAAPKGVTKGAAKAPEKKEDKAPEKKEETKPIKTVLVPEEIGIKAIANVINWKEAVGLKLKESKRWLYIIDRTNNVGTFLKYRDANIIDAKSPVEFDPERIRLAFMGALRYGKAFVIDISDTDVQSMLGLVEEKINGICSGLYNDLMDRSILEEDKCNRMYRPSDDDQYKNPLDYLGQLDSFQFVVLSNVDPPSTVMGDFFPVIVA